MLEGRILITGGTGSLGRALLLRAQEQGWNADITIFSRDETKQSILKQKYPQYRYILGDVAKYADVKRAFRHQNYVFHFGAYKQVPASLNNVPATIETNVIGSQNVVDAAIECGVEKVVASSTDKACLPSCSSYGQSKALMESIFQHGNMMHECSFHLARYGNVICSNSSVIPMFEKQAKVGGPLTLTHNDMSRFWITLDDAVDLILLALEQKPGTVVVPKAGAMSIRGVAETVISMYPEKDLSIEVLGIRSGEKIHESMVSIPESFYVWQDDKHFYINPPTSEVINPNYFSYSSDIAPKLSSEFLVNAINTYHRKFE